MASHKSVTRADAHPTGLITDYLEIDEAAAPGTPAAGKARLYVKADNKLYLKDEAGVETNITGGGGASASVPEWVAYLAERQGDETPHTDDDFFGSDSSGDYTTQTVSGSADWGIGRGQLGCVFEDQASGDLSAFIKPITSAVAPITIETQMSSALGFVDFPNVGMGFSDGTLVGSKQMRVVATGSDNSFTTGSTATLRWGTITDEVASGNANIIFGTSNAQVPSTPTVIKYRMIWKSANTWQASVSFGGDIWFNRGLANQSFTMTPTHFGFFVTSGASTVQAPVTFDYLRVDDADRSV